MWFAVFPIILSLRLDESPPNCLVWFVFHAAFWGVKSPHSAALTSPFSHARVARVSSWTVPLSRVNPRVSLTPNLMVSTAMAWKNDPFKMIIYYHIYPLTMAISVAMSNKPRVASFLPHWNGDFGIYPTQQEGSHWRTAEVLKSGLTRAFQRKSSIDTAMFLVPFHFDRVVLYIIILYIYIYIYA